MDHKKEECVMSKLRAFILAGPFLLLFLIFTAPAYAQFEVSPDHFEDHPAQPRKQATAAQKHVAGQMAGVNNATGRTKTKSKNARATHSSPPSTVSARTAVSKPRKRVSTKSHSRRATQTTAAARYGGSAAGSPAPRE
jgi:hypothetical protein